MSFKALIILPNGTVFTDTVIEEGLENLQEIVQGYIELLRITDDVRAFINEEGKLKNLPYNPSATFLCHALEIGLMPDDYIVGTIMFFGNFDENDEEDGKCHDCPPAFVEKAKEILGDRWPKQHLDFRPKQ